MLFHYCVALSAIEPVPLSFNTPCGNHKNWTIGSSKYVGHWHSESWSHSPFGAGSPGYKDVVILLWLNKTNIK